MIWGPHPEEHGYALHVCRAAEAFLDAYLEDRVKATHIRELAVALSDLAGSIPGDCEQRIADMGDFNWDSATYDPEMKCLRLDDTKAKEE